MVKFCLNVFTNCTDPTRELEFNRWYTHTHLPDLSKTKGFVTARRFTNPASDALSAKFYAQYEFDTNDPPATIIDFLDQALAAYASGRHIDCIEDSSAGSGVLWIAIEPDNLEPLDESSMNYPKEPTEQLTCAIREMKNKYSKT